MSGAPLACSVRSCGLALADRGRTFVCAHGHTYDVARSGYVNLLQPQDRRSKQAGDRKAAVEARARLLDAGIGRAVVQEMVRLTRGLHTPTPAVIAELGSGAGDALAALTDGRRSAGVGIDLSTAAADLAARRFPALTWVVANADRRVPLLDGSVDLMLSLHARRNPSECARVLRANGALLVATPAADDLVELRQAIQGHRVERERADQVVVEHEPFFTVHTRSAVRERHLLARDQLIDLLRGTYRGERLSLSARIDALGPLQVTLASACVLFIKR